MATGAITEVRLANGTVVPLSEYPCDNCGKPGVTHLTLHESTPTYAFCSWEHLMESMRIDDQPLTEDLMREAGLHVIGPRPEA